MLNKFKQFRDNTCIRSSFNIGCLVSLISYTLHIVQKGIKYPSPLFAITLGSLSSIISWYLKVYF